jgi:hypothetical protein
MSYENRNILQVAEDGDCSRTGPNMLSLPQA